MTNFINVDIQPMPRLAGEAFTTLWKATGGGYGSAVLRVGNWALFLEVREN